MKETANKVDLCLKPEAVGQIRKQREPMGKLGFEPKSLVAASVLPLHNFPIKKAGKSQMTFSGFAAISTFHTHKSKVPCK